MLQSTDAQWDGVRRWGMFGRCLGHEDGALMSGAPQSSHTPPALEGYNPKLAVCNQKEGLYWNLTMLAP